MSDGYPGSCHCRAIGYVYRPTTTPDNWSIRACQCRFCRAHDALSSSDPAGTLAFTADRPEALVRYRFGLRTADFLLCRDCGVYIGAVMQGPDGPVGIVNTHALWPRPDDLAAVAAISYDGEDGGDRESRRAARWTPVTQLP